MSEGSQFESANLRISSKRELTLQTYGQKTRRTSFLPCSVRVGKASATKKAFMDIPSLAKWDFTLQRISFPLDERFNGASKGKSDPPCCKMSAGIGFGDMAFRHRPSFWPYAHFKVKSRVLFAEFSSGTVLANVEQQHRLRRTVCKGWRNKQWHGRLMAFLELLSNKSSYIELPLSDSSFLRLDASPIRVTSPVTTPRPDEMPEDGEEEDNSTLGSPDIEEEDEC